MPSNPLGPHAHATTARLLWVAVLAGALLFLAVGTFVRSTNPPAAGPALGALPWIALAVAAAGLLGSRALALRPAPAEPAARLRRMIVQLALCEAATLLAGVAWLLLGAPLALAAAAVGLLGMLLAYPRGFPPAPGGEHPTRRMVR